MAQCAGDLQLLRQHVRVQLEALHGEDVVDGVQVAGVAPSAHDLVQVDVDGLLQPLRLLVVGVQLQLLGGGRPLHGRHRRTAAARRARTAHLSAAGAADQTLTLPLRSSRLRALPRPRHVLTATQGRGGRERNQPWTEDARAVAVSGRRMRGSASDDVAHRRHPLHGGGEERRRKRRGGGRRGRDQGAEQSAGMPSSHRVTPDSNRRRSWEQIGGRRRARRAERG